MTPPLAVAAAVQGGAGLLAAVAGAAVLVAPDPRRRALAVLAALVAAALALATLAGAAHKLTGHPALLAAGAVGGGMAVGGLALLLARHPGWLVPLAFAALPFRIPVPVGAEDANLLVLLYAVIAAGALAYAVPRLRHEQPARETSAPLRRLQLVLAGVMVLYALQALYSTDVEQAVKNIGFFYVPFAVLFRLLADLEWTARRAKSAVAVTAVLALAFAGIGLVERATRHLLVVNTKVETANELKPYFRVNSLFFDPNIYGRYLALTMVALATLLLWRRRGRDVWPLMAALTILWAGLVVSLSESSYAALLAGLMVLTALRWKPWPVIAAVAVAAVAAGVIQLASPGTFGHANLNRATSGRAHLIRGGLDMARDRPVYGFGSGAFADRYRAREHVFNPTVPAESHTIPITVAAEQGVIGLAAYVALMVAALALLFSRLRPSRFGAGSAGEVVARVAVAACFCALFVHTLVYASYLEDPLTWTLLAVGGGLRGA